MSAAAPACARESRRRGWLAIGLACWVALAGAHAVKTFRHPEKHSVFPLFSEAGQNWIHGRPLYVRAVVGGDNEFFYSPLFASAMAPFSCLPLAWGATLWTWLNLGLLLWSLRSFHAAVVARWRPALIEGQFLALAAVTTIQGGWSGQSNSIVLAFVLWSGVALVKGHPWRAGFCLALPVYIKVWPIIAAALLCVRYWRSLPLRLAVALVAIGLVPYLTAPPQTVTRAYAEWGARLVRRDQGNARYPGFRDAWTILENSTGAPDPQLYKLAQAVLGLCVLAWCVRNARQDWPRERWVLSTLAWWTLWQLLLGPGTERLTYGIAAPAVAFAVLDSPRRSGRGLLAWSAWFATGLLGTGDVERGLLRIWPAAEIITPCGVVILAAWFVHRDLQRDVVAEPASIPEPLPLRRAA